MNAAKVPPDIPARYRIGHEAHFSRLANAFETVQTRPPSPLGSIRTCSKYFVTTEGVVCAARAIASVLPLPAVLSQDVTVVPFTWPTASSDEAVSR